MRWKVASLRGSEAKSTDLYQVGTTRTERGVRVPNLLHCQNKNVTKSAFQQTIINRYLANVKLTALSVVCAVWYPTDRHDIAKGAAD